MAKYEIGLVGLGVMGRNLLLNMADHGYTAAGFDKDHDKVEALESESPDKVRGADTVEAFVDLLQRPRTIMMLVPAGKPVDAVIGDLVPHLDTDDMLVDAGNSHFRDTERRADKLAEKSIHFLGVGVSGGSEGARHGPSIMPGGSKDGYARVEAILRDSAAHVDGDPCVTWLGPRGAGHYVKMVHNGIEYGLMQLIAETYDLMKRGLGLSDEELHEVYRNWNDSELESFLLEITAHIFEHIDPETGKRLIDEVLDAAKQKGTGKWTSRDAMEIGAPVPTIDVAVAMRHLSALKDARQAAEKALSGPDRKVSGDRDGLIEQMRNAFHACSVITFAQGMHQLAVASETYDYSLNLSDVARIWRGGCIIRTALLEPIRHAFEDKPDLSHLLMAPELGKVVQDRQEDLRAVVQTAAQAGIPAPAHMASLAYFDGFRSGWLPANLIQAQRDDFGSHTYERIDEKGSFHTDW